MSTILAEEVVGQSLIYVGKKVGDAAAEHVCSMLMDTILGGGGSDAEADAEILAKLDEVLAGLDKIQDSLKQMEDAIAQVDSDIDDAFIKQNSSNITSLYFEYIDCLTKLTMAAKGSDPSSKQQYAMNRASLVDLSNQVKTGVPMNLQSIHEFVAGEEGTSNWLQKQAKANISKSRDIIDFYSKTKLPLIKIVMIQIKGIQLLRFAAANEDPGVNFSYGVDVATKALSNIDVQEQTLQSVIGPKDYNLVSTILTEFPKPVSACISLYETRGLTCGTRKMNSMWYGGQATQLWHIEPADSQIFTNGSKVNGFRLLNINNNKYISFNDISFDGIPMYSLLTTDSHKDAAIWTFQLTPEYKFYLQSKDHPDTCLMVDTESGDNDQTHRYVLMGYSSAPGRDTNSFIINVYQGPFNDIWPSNIPNMRDGDRLIPGSYLESPNKKHRLTFEGEKFGVWDVDKKSWEWDSGVSIDTSSDPYVVFQGPGELQLFQGSSQIKIWGSMYFPLGMDYVAGVSDGGILQIANGKSGEVTWSSG